MRLVKGSKPSKGTRRRRLSGGATPSTESAAVSTPQQDQPEPPSPLALPELRAFSVLRSADPQDTEIVTAHACGVSSSGALVFTVFAYDTDGYSVLTLVRRILPSGAWFDMEEIILAKGGTRTDN